MNGIDKCSGSCNFVNDLSTKVSVPRQTKNVNLKVFNMIMWIIEKKTSIKHVSCDSKCKLSGKYTIQIKNGIMINVNTSVKEYLMCKKDYSWNLRANVCENSKYLKSIV